MRKEMLLSDHEFWKNPRPYDEEKEHDRNVLDGKHVAQLTEAALAERVTRMKSQVRWPDPRSWPPSWWAMTPPLPPT